MSRMTNSEIQKVKTLRATGLSWKEIAERLGRNVITVRAHGQGPMKPTPKNPIAEVARETAEVQTVSQEVDELVTAVVRSNLARSHKIGIISRFI